MLEEELSEKNYAYVRCQGDSVPGQTPCGLVALTNKQYLRQMHHPNHGWCCPNCGSSASFDDILFEKLRDGELIDLLPPVNNSLVWIREEAIELCRIVEGICPQFGCHVAFTGGLLYKDGMRKDADLLFYRIRQIPKINVDGLFSALADVGFIKIGGFGWVYKALYKGKPVDCFFPEESKVIVTPSLLSRKSEYS